MYYTICAKMNFLLNLIKTFAFSQMLYNLLATVVVNFQCYFNYKGWVYGKLCNIKK